MVSTMDTGTFLKRSSYFKRSLLPIKAHYFFMYGAVAGVTPFLTVIGKDLGLNSVAVGIAYAVLSACVFLFKPLFGFLSDYFQNLKNIIMCLLTTTLMLFTCILLIKPIEKDINLSLDTRIICPKYNKIISFYSDDPCIKNSSSLSGMKCNITFSKIFAEEGTQNFENTVAMEAIYLCNLANLKINYLTMNSRETSCSLLLIGNDSELQTLCESNNSFDPSSFECDTKIETCPESKYEGKLYSTYQFWIFTFIVALGLGFEVAAMSLTDTACYEILGKNREHFGRQRLWGTVSTGSITLFSGYLNDLISKNKKKTEYLSGFYNMILMYIINMIILFKMNLPKVHLSKNMSSDISHFCNSKEILIYGGAVLILGTFASLNANFLFWHLKELGADQTLLGSVIAIQCLAEVPFFFYSGKIIKRIGYFNCLTCTFISFALRFGLYASLENPWFVLPIEVLHGITYAVFYASKTSFVSVYATPGTEATVLGILGALYDGLGFAMGSMFGGLGFHQFGGSLTFLIGSSLSLICIPFSIISHFVFKK